MPLKAMLHDLYLYDRATGSWTVDRCLMAGPLTHGVLGVPQIPWHPVEDPLVPLQIGKAP